jgi:hypothetical protein
MMIDACRAVAMSGVIGRPGRVNVLIPVLKMGWRKTTATTCGSYTYNVCSGAS